MKSVSPLRLVLRPSLVFVLFALCTMPGCFFACFGKSQPSLSDEDLAGEVFQKGAKVKAAIGNKTKIQRATFLEQYGKLAKLRFADNNTGWVQVKAIDPQGAMQLYPEDDKCEAEKGDKVRAPWSTSRSLFGATIDDTYGKMAHLQYDDGDADWVACDALKPPKEERAADDDDESNGGGGGGSDSATKCKRGCNKSCSGASNKAKCVGQCRRRCDS